MNTVNQRLDTLNKILNMLKKINSHKVQFSVKNQFSNHLILEKKDSQFIDSMINYHLQWGIFLRVQPDQSAVFYHQDEFLDVFYEGEYILKSQLVPKLSRWVTHYGFFPDSPFIVNIYFLNLKQLNSLSWETSQPILFSDPEFLKIPVSASGECKLMVNNNEKFFQWLIMNKEIVSIREFHHYFQEIITIQVAKYLAENVKNIRWLMDHFKSIVLDVKEKINFQISDNGLFVSSFDIDSILIPEKIATQLKGNQ